MAVDHHGLARLTELLPVVAAALRLHPHLMKGAQTSPGGSCDSFAHRPSSNVPGHTVNLSLRTGVPPPQPEAARTRQPQPGSNLTAASTPVADNPLLRPSALPTCSAT